MKFFFIACFVATGALQAVLPPLAQSAREIKALVSDPKLYEILGSPEVIQGIIRTETGYDVQTQHYRLRVDVRYLPSAMPGPAQFEFEFYQPVTN